MPRYVALLRAVNVGGRLLPMAALRSGLSEAGFAEVATYIQSGNVIFTAPRRSPSALADEVDAIARHISGLDVDTVVMTEADLRRVIDKNPYRDAATRDPKTVHALFTRSPLLPAARAWVAKAEAAARDKGGEDETTVREAVVYLHAPNGIGRSDLAARLVRGAASGVIGTMRNWRTVEKLLELCGTRGA